MVTPSLIVDEMSAWQSKVLRFVASLIGLRKGYVLWINIDPSDLTEFEFEKVEPTINDIVKNNEEDAMNRVRPNN
jgi:hypothetical protein